ncbi:hypothetical protein EMCRGX_G031645 [Ephydatia muelleri]
MSRVSTQAALGNSQAPASPACTELRSHLRKKPCILKREHIAPSSGGQEPRVCRLSTEVRASGKPPETDTHLVVGPSQTGNHSATAASKKNSSCQKSTLLRHKTVPQRKREALSQSLADERLAPSQHLAPAQCERARAGGRTSTEDRPGVAGREAPPAAGVQAGDCIRGGADERTHGAGVYGAEGGVPSHRQLKETNN